VTLYRDPLAGLRSQIATKRGLLESRDRALPGILRVMLPSRIRKILAIQGELGDEADSLEALTKLDATLDEILAAHEEAAELVPKLRECPDEVPDPPRPAMSPPWIIEEAPQLDFRHLFTRRLAEIENGAYLVRWGDTTYLSRFHLAGAPLIISCCFDSKCFARTSVPDQLPTLEVHEEGVFHAVGRALHLVRDHKTGDSAFDDIFVVDADDATAAVIGPDVRRAFADLAPFAPQLFVRRGVAELHWRSGWSAHPESLMPDAAFAILLGIRAAIERA
jgi:hypothetical protein